MDQLPWYRPFWFRASGVTHQPLPHQVRGDIRVDEGLFNDLDRLAEAVEDGPFESWGYIR